MIDQTRLAICTTAGAVAGFLAAKYIYDTGAADQGWDEVLGVQLEHH